jgi:hypothetical protein
VTFLVCFVRDGLHVVDGIAADGVNQLLLFIGWGK